MSRWAVCLSGVIVVGCSSKGSSEPIGEDSGVEEVAGPAPESCVAAPDVCTIYPEGWAEEEAAGHCADMGGTRGECPEGELGRCDIEDGLSYLLYAMPPLEAKGYCDWLMGEWTAAR